MAILPIKLEYNKSFTYYNYNSYNLYYADPSNSFATSIASDLSCKCEVCKKDIKTLLMKALKERCEISINETIVFEELLKFLSVINSEEEKRIDIKIPLLIFFRNGRPESCFKYDPTIKAIKSKFFSEPIHIIKILNMCKNKISSLIIRNQKEKDIKGR